MLTGAQDRFEFLMGCLLQGAISNPNVFTLEALRRRNGELMKVIVDSCAAAAEEALAVSDSRFDRPNGCRPKGLRSIGKALAPVN